MKPDRFTVLLILIIVVMSTFLCVFVLDMGSQQTTYETEVVSKRYAAGTRGSEYYYLFVEIEGEDHECSVSPFMFVDTAVGESIKVITYSGSLFDSYVTCIVVEE